MPAHCDSDAAGQERKPLLLRGMSLRQVAHTLYGLNSRVTRIEEQWDVDTHLLVYTFDIAGQRQPFSVPVTSAPAESIADLYPETAAWEQQLQEQGTVRFR